MGKFLGLFSNKPEAYIRYGLITGIVFFAHWTSSFFALELLTQDKPVLGWSILFAWYYLWIAIFDQLFYTILGGK